MGTKRTLLEKKRELAGVKKHFNVATEKNQVLKKLAYRRTLRKAEGEESKTDVQRWAGFLIEDTKRWKGMTDARLLQVCRAATLTLEKLNVAPHTEQPDEPSPQKKALQQRSYRAASELQEKLGDDWKKTVSDYITGCKRETVFEMIPEHVGEFVKEGKEKLMQSISDYYSIEVLLDLKIRCKLSRRGYTDLRRYLCKMKDSKGLWVPLEVDGVEMIPFASEKALRRLSKAIIQEYGMRKVGG